MKDEVAFVTLWTLKRSRNRVKMAFSVEKSQMDHEGLPRGSLSPAPRLRFREEGLQPLSLALLFHPNVTWV